MQKGWLFSVIKEQTEPCTHLGRHDVELVDSGNAVHLKQRSEIRALPTNVFVGLLTSV